MLLGMLKESGDGLHDDDEKVRADGCPALIAFQIWRTHRWLRSIDWVRDYHLMIVRCPQEIELLMRSRTHDMETKAAYLNFWCACVIQKQEPPDADYRLPSTPEREAWAAADASIDAQMEESSNYSSQLQSQELEGLMASQGSAGPGTPGSAASSPAVGESCSCCAFQSASSSASHTRTTRRAGPGAPAWKALEGAAAQQVARDAAKRDCKPEDAAQLVAGRLEVEASEPVEPAYVAKQAKALG